MSYNVWRNSISSSCRRAGKENRMEGVFTIEQIRPIRDGMTVSMDAGMGGGNRASFFSLGRNTSISRECYDETAVYIGASGKTDFLLGEPAEERKLAAGEMLIVPGGMLCGQKSEEGSVYTEIIMKKETHMNSIVKAGEAMKLKDLIPYEQGSIANLDIVRNDTMKFVLMAFDEGTGLTPHRAPGNAIIFALEGKATVGYEGKDYILTEGESFRFEKNGLHSVTAEGKFKMAILLVIE